MLANIDSLCSQGDSVLYTLYKANEGEACPVTMSPMHEHGLHFVNELAVPHNSFPEHLVMQLGCGHRFCAIAAHFNRVHNGMRCPICRAGDKECCDIMEVPEHLRDAMVSHSNRMKSLEEKEIFSELLEVGHIIFLAKYYFCVSVIYSLTMYFLVTSYSWQSIVSVFPLTMYFLGIIFLVVVVLVVVVLEDRIWSIVSAFQ